MKRHGTAVPPTWVEQQRAFFAKREAWRAEVCACGHGRVFHQNDCASCIRYGCDCLSFSLHQYQEVSL